ncbi:hypothetical protein F2Q69_00018256 [Brassica cretica]|uniref:RING-type E3 ubiquitin transferase n=1 Tax=Brassica cretica TaxID=69181 RepID=A0A8S9Q8E6_BRACR|nr:hypothetical protein F2Q69_00018256 [Brassica cretica]
MIWGVKEEKKEQNPCEHAFCLECARSDSIFYLCDERIQKIQTIKMMEGIFICAAPHCLRSFLKKPDFEAHVHDLQEMTILILDHMNEFSVDLMSIVYST